MKRLQFLLVSALLVGGILPARADEATKTAKVEEMFKVAKLDQLFSQTLSMVSNQMKSAAFQRMFGVKLPPEQQKTAEEFQDKVTQLITETLSWDALKPTYVKLYTETYTESEIDGLLAFYKSPSGQAMVSKTPQLMTQANQVVQQRMMTTMQPKLQALMKEYMGRVQTATPPAKQ